MEMGEGYRFPTTKPGWSVAFPGDPQLSREVDDLIGVCESSLMDAALCLALFEATQAHQVDPRMPDWAPSWRPLFIYAREFVFALDTIGKSLNVIANETRLVEVRSAVDDFSKAIPTLTAVRDTAHHLEDRARGRDKHKKPLDLRPFTILGVDFPRGLYVGNLFGSSYGGTAGSGEHATVEVTTETLEVARRALQRVLDALPWEGAPQLSS